MERDVFSRCHPLTGFAYFFCAICFCAVVRHPMYLAAGFLAGLFYYRLLYGTEGMKKLPGMVPFLLAVAALNPVLNPRGETLLFTLFGRPYTLEALVYGVVLAGMLGTMLVWFGCFSTVLTGEKIVYLFAPIAPALSLVLVMTMRLIPSFQRKLTRLAGARRCIGFGLEEQTQWRGKLRCGAALLASLTDWALEGSIITADAMRARGYGTGKRTHYRAYRLSARDGMLLGLTLGLSTAAVTFGGMQAEFLPSVSMERPGWGLAVYCLLLALPVLSWGKEELQWRLCIRRI